MLSHSGSHFKQGDNYAISSYIFFKDESHNCNICYPGDNTAEQLQKRGTGSSGYSVKEGSGQENAAGAGDSSGDAQEDPVSEDLSDGLSSEEDEGTGDKVCVFVCGAVNCEGVYELPEGSRVIDAVRAAGGYSDDADSKYVNQAEYVYDTQRIEIPTREEADLLRENDPSEKNEEGGPQDDGRIDLNTAGKQELMTLPGIGESKADRILEYRLAHGRFSSTEELMNVSGIGSGVYENMKDRITVK